MIELLGLDPLHLKLLEAKQAGEPPEALDAILQACQDGECYDCGRVICPHNEPLHFHHDGCPACDAS